MMETIEFLKTLLSQFFNYNHYHDGIRELKEEIKTVAGYQAKWEDVKKMISQRLLPAGLPLNLIHNSANLPLYENTDEEAYKWLDLMIKNVETKEAIEYY